MELFVEEAAAGKLFYPAKDTLPKKEEPPLPAPAPLRRRQLRLQRQSAAVPDKNVE